MKKVGKVQGLPTWYGIKPLGQQNIIRNAYNLSISMLLYTYLW